jgi:hypothetical protein
MKWAGHVARIGEERKMCNVLVLKPERKKERDHSDQGVDGRMGLKEIGFDCLKIGAGGELL